MDGEVIDFEHVDVGLEQAQSADEDGADGESADGGGTEGDGTECEGAGGG